MVWFKSLSKKISDVLTDSILFVPKGLFLPMAQGLDEIRHRLSKERIYCEFHQKKSKKVKKKPLYLKTCRFFDKAQSKIKPFVRWMFFKLFYYFNKILPRFVLNLSRRMWGKIKGVRKAATHFGKFLKKHRDKMIWFGLLPSLLLWGLVATCGVGIVPQLYLFYVTSYWSGKLLSQFSNLLVLGKNAPEWIFLKNALDVVRGKCSFQRFYQKYRNRLFDNAKWLFLHLIPVVLLGSVSKFVAWCFCEFISWLAIYCVFKRAAERAPTRLYKYERYLNSCDKTSPKPKNCRLSNACWLISYHVFKRTASEKAHHTFEKLHCKTHSRYNLRLSSRIK